MPTRRYIRKATDLLKQQHRAVRAIFAQIRKTGDAETLRDLLDELQRQLRTHMEIEETIFYPALRDSSRTRRVHNLVPQAYEEHHLVRLMLNELPGLGVKGERFEARMALLEQLIDHHIAHEEKELFPAVEKLAVETLEDLGSEMESAAEQEAEADCATRDACLAEREDDEFKRES